MISATLRVSVCFQLVFVFSAAVFAQSDTRTWTSSNGKFEIEATFESFDGTNVELKKPNGKTIKVPIEKLSRKDRKFAERAAQEAAERDAMNQARLKAEKENAAKFDVAGLLRIGVPDDGFVWGKVTTTSDSGGTLVDCTCENQVTKETVQLLLSPYRVTEQALREELAFDLLKSFVESLEQIGFTDFEIQKPKPERKRKNLLVATCSGKTASGKAVYLAYKAKFGETMVTLSVLGEDVSRAESLCDVINSVREQNGDEFQTILEDLRRIKVANLGIAIPLPLLDMDLTQQDNTSVRLQSPGKAHLFVRTMDAGEGADIDKGWNLMKRMAIPPNRETEKEGSAKVAGNEARFISYLHSAAGDKIWGTTWFVRGPDRFYVVTGMCLESKKDSEGKSLLEAIKGIKFL